MHYKLTVAFLFLFIISGCQTAYMTGISKAVLIDKEEKLYTRTETIEIYRQNMSKIRYTK